MANEIKERPILFNGEMVRAILEGRKTVTRRIIKPQPEYVGSGRIHKLENLSAGEQEIGVAGLLRDCPYGKPGERLWVRETWRPCKVPQHGDSQCVEYRATDYCKAGHLTTLNRTGWKPSIFMPRWASRLTLEITEVRIERLQDISEDDAIAEGIPEWIGVVEESSFGAITAISEFKDLWDRINGDKPGCSWKDSPWVWVISFRKVEDSGA